MQIADTLKGVFVIHCFQFCGVDLHFYFSLTPSHSLLHSILKDSNELFIHSSGILLFRVENRFVTTFSPTFLLFDFSIKNLLWCEVNIWFGFNEIHSSGWSFELLSLKSWIANLWNKIDSGKARLFITWMSIYEIIGPG